MARPISLPSHVYLRAAPALPCREAYKAFGATRQRVHQWRRNGHGFPASEGGKIDAQALAVWLASRGCRVTFI